MAVSEGGAGKQSESHGAVVRRLGLTAVAAAVLLVLAPFDAHAKLIFSLRDAGTVSTDQLVASLRGARVIFFGERHSSAEDHVAQRTVIQALHESGVSLAIGMEMFRREAQPDLDRWVAGDLDERALRAVYDSHWDSRLYEQYNEILLFARQERIPLVGLNVGRDIIGQVTRGGFGSLSEEQRRELRVDSCDITERYADILRRVTGGKERGQGAFVNFCQAQIVWDAAMARTIADYIQPNRERILLVMCGNFHAWRHGIPGRLAALTDAPVKIVLPAGDETVKQYDILLEDADYIWRHQ